MKGLLWPAGTAEKELEPTGMVWARSCLEKVSGGGAFVRVLGQGAGKNPGEAVGQVGAEGEDVGRRNLQVHAEQFAPFLGLERRPAGKEEKEDGGEGVDVGLGGGGLAPDDFGGHVGGGAHGTAGHGESVGGVVDAGETEVGDLAPAGAGQHQVLGFDVAVDHAELGGVGEGFGGFGGELAGAVHVERATGFDQGVQGAPLDEFHGDVVVAAGIADFVDLDDGGVFEGGGGARFADELFDAVSLGAGLALEALEGDLAFEGGVFGADDLAHASLAEDGDEAELAEHHGLGGSGAAVAGGGG